MVNVVLPGARVAATKVAPVAAENVAMPEVDPPDRPMLWLADAARLVAPEIVKPKLSSELDQAAPYSSSPSTSSDSDCASCGMPHVQIRYVTRSFGSGSGLLVIEGVPMWSCAHCGASYFAARTLHEIERIKALRKSVAVSRPVPVAQYQA